MLPPELGTDNWKSERQPTQKSSNKNLGNRHPDNQKLATTTDSDIRQSKVSNRHPTIRNQQQLPTVTSNNQQSAFDNRHPTPTTRNQQLPPTDSPVNQKSALDNRHLTARNRQQPPTDTSVNENNQHSTTDTRHPRAGNYHRQIQPSIKTMSTRQPTPDNQELAATIDRYTRQSNHTWQPADLKKSEEKRPGSTETKTNRLCSPVTSFANFFGKEKVNSNLNNLSTLPLSFWNPVVHQCPFSSFVLIFNVLNFRLLSR